MLEFLLAHGNRRAHSWPPDGWRSDLGGELHYYFTEPLNAAQLREHFSFPDSIQVEEDGSIRDYLNRVDIRHERLVRFLSFELSPEHLSLAVDTPPRMDPPALDDEQADKRLRQLIGLC